MKQSDIVDVARRFVEAPYALGDTDKGWDCLSLIMEFYRQLGVTLPVEHRGINISNYADVWKGGGGRAEFFEYLTAIGEEIEPNYAILGDLMIFDYGNNCVAPGIYLGNGTVLCAYEKGIFVIPLRFIKKHLYEVRRCLT